MRVLELCLSPDLGGLELYAWRCAVALGQEHEVIGVIHSEGRLREYFERDRIPWVGIATRFRALPLVAARRLARLIDRERVDIIHMHWGKDLALAALAKHLSRRRPKLVYTRQMQITRPKRDAYHTFVWRQVDRVLAITELLAGRLRGFLPAATAGRVTTLYYGVSAPATFPNRERRRALRTELGLPEEKFIVGLLGRIKASKGQHLLVEAVGRLAADAKPVHGVIVGRAMELDYLERLKRHCIEQDVQVTFLDFTDQPQQLMQACDVVVLASDEETFGLVLAEAMRAGVAVVGTRAGGVTEIIDHQQTGLLFAPGDAADLEQQLRRLVDDPGLCAALAATGRAKADRLFDREDHFARLADMLKAEVGHPSA